MDAPSLDSRETALDLCRLLRDLDGSRQQHGEALARRRADMERRIRDMLESAARGDEATADQDPAPSEGVIVRRWGEVAELLRRVDVEGQADLRAELARAYEGLSAALRAASVRLPGLRPGNLRRNAFHVGMGVGVVVLIEEALTPTTMGIVAGAFAALAWTLELSRRMSARVNRALMRIFSPVSHPHEEHRINSSTWYTTALCLLGLLGEPLVAAVAVGVLAAGDPAAALVGRRFGRTRLLNGRSLEGSAAFVVAGGALAWATLRVWHPELDPAQGLVVAGAAALLGAVGELASGRIDANFSIPLAAALGAAGARAWLTPVLGA